MPKWFEIFNAANDCTKVHLYGDIGEDGVTAKDFCNQLQAIKTPKIAIHINSLGGEVFDGFAIYNAIKSHDSEITCCVDGIAASSAATVAIAGDKVQMGRNAFMMIHPVQTRAFGSSDKLREAADVMDRLTDSVANAYSEKTGKPVDQVVSAMNKNTWFNAVEAKAWGLCDEISEDDVDENRMSRAAKNFLNQYENAPPELRKFAARLDEKLKPTPKKETPMEKIEMRDGKYFIGDEEVDISSLPVPTNEAALTKARNDATEAERSYRSMFNTVVETTKLAGEDAKKFEKDFYGRAESDLKFLASHSIGERAKPVGEGAPGNGEGDADPTNKEADKVVATAKKRWDDEPRLRKMHGCLTSNPDDAQYKDRMNRYVRAVNKNAKDAKNGGKFEEIREGDAVSAALANKGMLVVQ